MLVSLQSLMKILHALPSTSLHDHMSISGSQDVKLLLYYDEAHEIVNSRTFDFFGVAHGITIYSDLLSCINSWLSVDTQVMAVFASTSFEIDPVITPTVPPMITRDTLQTPLCSTPFDNSPRLLELNRSEWNLKTTSTTEFMAQFGRPM